MNIHTPERQANESQQAYRARRAKSHATNKSAGPYLFENQVHRRIEWETGSARRATVKAAGGIRQFKRARSAPLRAAKLLKSAG